MEEGLRQLIERYRAAKAIQLRDSKLKMLPLDDPRSVAVRECVDQLKQVLDEETKRELQGLSFTISDRRNFESDTGHYEEAGVGSGDGHSFDDRPDHIWVPDRRWTDFTASPEERERARRQLLDKYDSSSGILRSIALGYIVQNSYDIFNLRDVFIESPQKRVKAELDDLIENADVYSVIATVSTGGSSIRHRWDYVEISGKAWRYIIGNSDKAELREMYANISSYGVARTELLYHMYHGLPKDMLLELYNGSPDSDVRRSASRALKHTRLRFWVHEHPVKARLIGAAAAGAAIAGTATAVVYNLNQ